MGFLAVDDGGGVNSVSRGGIGDEERCQKRGFGGVAALW